jgi:hypothetical protein
MEIGKHCAAFPDYDTRHPDEAIHQVNGGTGSINDTP